MRKILCVLFLLALGAFAYAKAKAPVSAEEEDMAYCTREELNAAYGEDRINGWSRLNAETIDRAIGDAGAEIDGYLLSGGYAVPLPGPPDNIKKYCIDIAASNLVIGAGVMNIDPGGQAVIEQANIARRYLNKVAEGKFKIPGYTIGGELAKPPSGGVRVSTRPRLDLRGFL
jgi:phage gp36-like protein